MLNQCKSIHNHQHQLWIFQFVNLSFQLLHLLYFTIVSSSSWLRVLPIRITTELNSIKPKINLFGDRDFVHEAIPSKISTCILGFSCLVRFGNARFGSSHPSSFGRLTKWTDKIYFRVSLAMLCL